MKVYHLSPEELHTIKNISRSIADAAWDITSIDGNNDGIRDVITALTDDIADIINATFQEE